MQEKSVPEGGNGTGTVHRPSHIRFYRHEPAGPPSIKPGELLDRRASRRRPAKIDAARPAAAPNRLAAWRKKPSGKPFAAGREASRRQAQRLTQVFIIKRLEHLRSLSGRDGAGGLFFNAQTSRRSVPK